MCACKLVWCVLHCSMAKYRLGGKGFRHGRSVLKSKCSFHTCSIGSSLVLSWQLQASVKPYATERCLVGLSSCTWPSLPMLCLVLSRFFPLRFVRYCTWSEAIAECLVPTWPMQSSPVSKAYVPWSLSWLVVRQDERLLDAVEACAAFHKCHTAARSPSSPVLWSMGCSIAFMRRRLQQLSGVRS